MDDAGVIRAARRAQIPGACTPGTTLLLGHNESWLNLRPRVASQSRLPAAMRGAFPYPESSARITQKGIVMQSIMPNFDQWDPVKVIQVHVPAAGLDGVLVAASDSGCTLHDAGGLDVAALIAFRSNRRW